MPRSGRPPFPNGAQQWRLAISLFLLLFGLHGLLLGLLLGRAWARPMLAVLLAVTAGASYYMQSYGVYLDADMLRNVLHTDWAESRELLTPGLVLHLLLHAGLPILVLWRLKLVRRSLPQGLLVRAGFLLLMWVVMMLGAAISFKDLSSLVRNQHQVRYLVTPANYLYGLGRLATSSSALKGAALLPVGEDAHQVPAAAARKPRLLVLVVGETVRAQNWGLSGYPRQTTPELARLPVVNFRDTRACGSSTEVSLPCMFSALGRRITTRARSAASSRCCMCCSVPGWTCSGVTTRVAARGCAVTCRLNRSLPPRTRSCAMACAAWTRSCCATCPPGG
jgi:Predicted membrane-associated, metal-dependent hydrolase